MEEQRQYQTAGSVLIKFMERLFVVMTVGVLFTFVTLRAEISQEAQPTQVASAKLEASERTVSESQNDFNGD